MPLTDAERAKRYREKKKHRDPSFVEKERKRQYKLRVPRREMAPHRLLSARNKCAGYKKAARERTKRATNSELHRVLLHIEQEDKRDVQSEVVLQVSQEGRRGDVQSEIILHHIKCENGPPPEYLQEGSVGNLNGHCVNDWRSVKCEEQLQEFNEQQSSLPSTDTCRVSTWTCDVNQLGEVKQEKEADCDDHDRSSGETRHCGRGWCTERDQSRTKSSCLSRTAS